MEAIKMKTVEQILLEKELKKIAKEIKIKDKYINNIFNKYDALWIIHNKVKGYFAMFGNIKTEGKKRNLERVKLVRENRTDVIKRMERLAQLFRLYKALKEVEELKQILFIEQPEEETLTTLKV